MMDYLIGGFALATLIIGAWAVFWPVDTKHDCRTPDELRQSCFVSTGQKTAQAPIMSVASANPPMR